MLQRTGATTGLVRSFLEQMLQTSFKLESASVDPFGGRITIDGVSHVVYIGSRGGKYIRIGRDKYVAVKRMKG